MSVPEIITGIVLIIFSLLIIVIVLMQQGREANLGAIQGAADSFMDKGRARTIDARLARYTKYLCITYFVLVFLGMIFTKFFK